ncbi:MAG: hypothetical protein MPJ50_16940 [Pirellulales bacterium]|nr:hypothetical protein [Pirellulales bacterium]
MSPASNWVRVGGWACLLPATRDLTGTGIRWSPADSGSDADPSQRRPHFRQEVDWDDGSSAPQYRHVARADSVLARGVGDEKMPRNQEKKPMPERLSRGSIKKSPNCLVR